MEMDINYNTNFTQMSQHISHNFCAQAQRVGDWQCIICHNLNFAFRN